MTERYDNRNSMTSKIPAGIRVTSSFIEIQFVLNSKVFEKLMIFPCVMRKIEKCSRKNDGCNHLPYKLVTRPYFFHTIGTFQPINNHSNRHLENLL